MMKKTLFIFFNLLVIQLLSQNIHVSGEVEAGASDRIRIIVYADQFSMLEKTISQTFANEHGNFVLDAEVPHTTYGFFACNLEKGEFYLTPGASYQIMVPKIAQQEGSVFDKLPLQFSLEVKDDSGLQNDIGRFNQLYNAFVYDNAQVIYRSRNKSVINDFRAKVDSEFSQSKNTYLKQYIHYAFVSLDWLSKRMSDQQVLSNELISKPVLYQNIQYTEFFKTFFDNYLENLANKHFDELIFALNQTNNYSGLKTLIQQDTLLKKNDQITELAMMLLMSKFYHVPDVKKKNIIKKFKLLANESKSNQNKEIAQHFIEKLTQLDYGYPAPDFSLAGKNGTPVGLKKHRGKFVLLQFVSEDCQICLNDLNKIQKIQQSLSDSLAVITLVTSSSGSNMTNLPYSWDFLTITPTDLLPEAYHVRTFPTYVLINPDGTMAYATMPMPDEKMELMIHRFMDRYAVKNK